MAGNKHSGRHKMGWIAPGTGEEGTETVTTQTITKQAGHPIIKKLDRALANADDMDVTDFMKTVFDAGAEGLWVFRIVNGEEYKVGTLKPGMDFSDDGETFLMSHYGGPGTFVLKAAVKTAFGGMIRASKPKRVRLGVSSDQDAGSYAMPGNDADTIITRTLAREEKIHALNKIKEMNREPVPRKEADDMRPDEIITIVNALKGSDKTSEILLEMLRTERERMTVLQAASVQKNPLDLLAPMAAPLLAFFDKKLSPGMVTKWIEALRNPGPEAAPETLWSGLRGILNDLSPILQPIIQNVVATLTPPAVPGRPTLVPNLPALSPIMVQPPNPNVEGADMATRNFTDDDTKEMMDQVIIWLDEHKFAEAWAALRGNEDTLDVIAPIAPGPDPLSFWFKVRDVDERMRTRKDVGLEFIAYIQAQITVWIAAQVEAERKAAEERGETVPPSVVTVPPAA